MLVATVLLGGGVEITNAATRQINASNSLLSSTHVSPLMSYQAAESMLEYKNGSWLFSYEISELKALAVTLPSADPRHRIGLHPRFRSFLSFLQ